VAWGGIHETQRKGWGSSVVEMLLEGWVGLQQERGRPFEMVQRQDVFRGNSGP